MNLYSRKQRWKAVLLIFAVVIVGLSLWYSNYIVNKIRQEERLKVQLWSEAVQRRLSLINYTEKLFSDMRREERNKADVWAQAIGRIAPATDSELPFLQTIIQNNSTIPVLVVDAKNEIISYNNIDYKYISTPEKADSTIAAMRAQYKPIRVSNTYFDHRVYYKDSRIITELEKTLDDLINSFISETVMNSGSVPVLVTDSSRTGIVNFSNIDSTLVADSTMAIAQIAEMAAKNEPIQVKFGDRVVNYIYYTDSIIITQLRYFPFVQLVIIGLFLFISYLIFSTFRNAEQNQVWIGLAKETAHQLGTPLSSLIAWVQLLEARGTDKETIAELNKDIKRLEIITDRFSKIGSAPELTDTVISDVMNSTIDYLRPRISKKVEFNIKQNQDGEIKAMINQPLFSWVIENIIKNAVDAMNGKGKITVEICNEIQNVYIDITDTGKGIPASGHKAVFQPGYTTKKRGWGLGLSLAKRIIEIYHSGKIFVKRSEPDSGTTFRIVLKTNQ
ncbi:HAMP domain-containing sensor histidine kinase [Cryomorphaceae bacterium 1068]|nr:HAMP domain-containing sensor histidine kinase [Cryomorphaceae bacterium 1068]